MNGTETMRRYKAGKIDQKQALQEVGEALKAAKLKADRVALEMCVSEIIGLDAEPVKDAAQRHAERAFEKRVRKRTS